MAESKVDVTDLSDISETTLLTLYCRASEAARPHPIIDDPLAMRLVEQIDYDFGKFEQTAIPKTLPQLLRPNAQYFAVRAASFDRAIHAFLRQHPRGTVIALAEGLQTTFWRVNHPTVRWISLDLPAVIALREKLLPPSPQITHITASALDPGWCEQIDPDGPTLITAEGLLMYLQPSDALDLVGTCAQRNPGGTMIFDMAPPPANQANWQWTPRYRIPAFPFTRTGRQVRKLAGNIPDVQTAIAVPFVHGRGLRGRLHTALSRYPVLSYAASSITQLRFRRTALRT